MMVDSGDNEYTQENVIKQNRKKERARVNLSFNPTDIEREGEGVQSDNKHNVPACQ